MGTSSTMIKFAVKCIILLLLVCVIAFLTPVLAKYTDKIINKFKSRKNNDELYKTDVFGASYSEDLKNNNKKKEKK